MDALNALSVGAQEAAQSSGAQSVELAEVFVNLQIGVPPPGQLAHHRRGPGLDIVEGAGGVRNRSALALARRVDG